MHVVDIFADRHWNHVIAYVPLQIINTFIFTCYCKHHLTEKVYDLQEKKLEKKKPRSYIFRVSGTI